MAQNTMHRHSVRGSKTARQSWQTVNPKSKGTARRAKAPKRNRYLIKSPSKKLAGRLLKHPHFKDLEGLLEKNDSPSEFAKSWRIQLEEAFSKYSSNIRNAFILTKRLAEQKAGAFAADQGLGQFLLEQQQLYFLAGILHGLENVAEMFDQWNREFQTSHREDTPAEPKSEEVRLALVRDLHSHDKIIAKVISTLATLD